MDAVLDEPRADAVTFINELVTKAFVDGRMNNSPKTDDESTPYVDGVLKRLGLKP
jgi:hypothetical protein